MRTTDWISLFALFVIAQGIRQEDKNLFDLKAASGQRCMKYMVPWICEKTIDWSGNEKCIRALGQPPVNAASCRDVVAEHETVGVAVADPSIVTRHKSATSKAFSAARKVFATQEDEKAATKEDTEQGVVTEQAPEEEAGATTEDTAQEVVTEQAPEEEAGTMNEDKEHSSDEDVPESEDTSPLKQAFYADQRTEELADWAECINMCEGFKVKESQTGECDSIRSLEDCKEAQKKLEHEDATKEVLSLSTDTAFSDAKNFGCQVVHRKKNDDRMVWLQKGEWKYNNVCGLYPTES